MHLELKAPVHGQVVAVEVVVGQQVVAGQLLLVQEAMKMHMPLHAPQPAEVLALWVQPGDLADAGQALVQLRLLAPAPSSDAGRAAVAGAPPLAQAAAAAEPDLAPQLQRLRERQALLADGARPEAMARRHAQGRRSVRENLADLLDAGSFTEYGAMAIAAQRSRRPLDELQRQTPADGVITGTGTVAGRPVAVMAYDYTVLAGTQGLWGHAKSDRLLELCQRHRLPLVLLAEGGGGRPGDVDAQIVAGLHCSTFARLAALAGQVPVVGIVAGRCFAGNAALLGCCDLIIAVEGASIGLGGPAMIEGGGLGRVEADAVGPVDDLAHAGVVDVRVPDEAAAVAVARQYLAMVAAAPAGRAANRQGSDVNDFSSLSEIDPTPLRHAVPQRRQTVFDPHPIVCTVMDAGSVLELRPEFGRSVITVLARLHGRAVALACSQPAHLGGALDAPSCDKLARFMQLADAHGLPLITLVDSPGFMVGPASERTGMVRHAGRLFVNAAALRVPVASVVLRRGYGLGAMALTAGHFHAPVATCAWPAGEFGGMGLEGAVRLGHRKELEAAGDEAAREALFQRLLAEALARGQALNMASHLEIDEVIDPAESRARIASVLPAGSYAGRAGKKRSCIDTW